MSGDGTFDFYVGLHQPSDGKHFDLACISINRLRSRKKPIGSKLLIDSGAFTELAQHGKYRHSVSEYAAQLFRLWNSGCADIMAAVAQDFMCEPFMLAKTKATGACDGTVEDHQRLTIERYDALLIELHKLFGETIPFHVLPVLQGFSPADYARHVVAYGPRLVKEMWVGVGSVCKRQGDPRLVAAVLRAVKAIRPDLRLHGFGVKLTSLRDRAVRSLLATADSMAWSFSARKQGRSANDWHEAKAFVERVLEAVEPTPQLELFAA